MAGAKPSTDGTVRLTGYLVIFAVFAALAAPHAATADSVAQRRQSMRKMADAIRTMAWMFEGRVAYDRDTAVSAAATIRSLAGKPLTDSFAPGTLGPPSRAKAEIALETDEFAALARHLEEVATAFAGTAAAGPTSLTGSMRMGSSAGMGNPLLGSRQPTPQPDLSKIPLEHLLHLMMADCGSCHAKFRDNAE